MLHRCRLAGELTDEALTVARERLDEVLAGIDILELSKQINSRRLVGSCGFRVDERV